MLLPLAALIAACSGEEELAQQPEQPGQTGQTEMRAMTFGVGEGQTRTGENPKDFTAVTKDVHIRLSAQHIVGDKVQATAGLPDNTLLKFQKGNAAVMAKFVAEGCYYPKEGRMKFVAFTSDKEEVKGKFDEGGNTFTVNYPNNSINETDNIMFAVPSDIADLTQPFADPSLYLHHAMSKLEFSVSAPTKNQSAYKLKLAGIVIEDAKLAGDLEISLGTSTTASWANPIEGDKEVKFDGSQFTTTTESGYSGSIYLIPQTIDKMQLKLEMQYPNGGHLRKVTLEYTNLGIDATGMGKVKKVTFDGSALVREARKRPDESFIPDIDATGTTLTSITEIVNI